MSTKMPTMILFMVVSITHVQADSVYLFLKNIPMDWDWGISVYKYNPQSTLEININVESQQKANEFLIEILTGVHTPYLTQHYLSAEPIKSASLVIETFRGNITLTLYNVHVVSLKQTGPIQSDTGNMVHDVMLWVADRVEWLYEDHRQETVHFGWDFKENKAWLPNETNVVDFRLQ